MELKGKKREGNEEYCYFAKTTSMDKKALKSVDFEYIGKKCIDGTNCEIWRREV